METQRVFIIAAIFLISFFLYSKWQIFTAPEQPAPVAAEQTTTNTDGAVPNTPSGVVANPAIPTEDQPAVSTDVITVETDLLVAQINPKGGVVESLRLKQEPEAVETPEIGFELLKNSEVETFITQSGLIGNNGSYPNHTVQYQAAATEYALGDADDQLQIPLVWVSPEGQRFTKVFTFNRDSYVVSVDYQLTNQTAADWSGYLYAQFKRTEPLNEKKGSFFQLPSYRGGVIYTPEEKYQKVKFKTIRKKPLDTPTNSGWVGMLQHYFAGVWMLDEAGKYNFYSSYKEAANPEYTIGYKTLQPLTLAPGETGSLGTKAFLGPKEQTRLKAIQNDGVDGLALTVDYGWLTFIADPLFWVLDKIHSLVKNWGWSIIILTILIKLVFYPLSAASYRSMANMKKLQPRMETLKERFADDRAKLQEAMMKLYKEEKVNPAGGCLPILVQIPVFIALYYVLLESVELRQAPFALWWQDLSAPDPYYVLPILMGASMFLQQRLNPAISLDPIQRNVFLVMPIVLTLLFLTFPQGLVLYWVVNNLLSILQQWRINTVIGARN